MEDYNQYFSFPIGEDQKKAFDALWRFVESNERDVFILNGYAGTGKTSLIGGFIQKLYQNNKVIVKNYNKKSKDKMLYEVNVLASTGRAAKILSDKTITKAKTIHSMLYKPTYIEEDTEVIQFELFALEDTFGDIRIYIVDEASMVGDIDNPTDSAAQFGEGNVLKDLFKFDPEGKFIFVGDPCQLNPVGQKISPALEPEHLKQQYGKKVVVHTLNTIFRQQGDNDILLAATTIRKVWQKYVPDFTTHPRYGKQEIFTNLPLLGYQRIKTCMSESELVTQYTNLIREKGYSYSTMICHSNKECATAGDIVRQMLHGRREHLIEGDLLLVTQNNYLVDLVNGDLVEVKKILHSTRTVRANMSFVRVEVVPLHTRNNINKSEEKEYITGDGYSLFMVEDILKQGTLNLDTTQTKELMKDFIIRMEKRNIKPPKKHTKAGPDHPFFIALSKDPYMNALRATYGYALTCHKAQGGEWEEVFINLAGNSLFARRGKELYQWIYTALTRAKEQLHLITGRFVI
ncbi:MAG: AAA family ATPase [Prevotellaceae bacterium]|jgi:ATP-dependent exoDNAse (exonuclease V) alpha subunit|nr:AAA family ATPase [Prevotellaceae bacterium]